MNVSEIAIQPPGERRRVGIRYPDRTRVMWDAIRIWNDLVLDVEIEDTTISLELPQPSAAFYAGMLERFTGRMAFNEWVPATLSE